MDLREISSIADYFVICSGNSDRHVKAIINEIEVKLKYEGAKVYHRDIDPSYHWCVLDYGSVIVHVFYDKTRKYYRLENLWSDAQEVEI